MREPHLRVRPRQEQDGVPSSIGAPATLLPPGSAAATPSSIVFAATPFTFLTQTIAVTGPGTPVPVTITRTLAITDQAQLSSALREGIPPTATGVTSSTPRETSPIASTGAAANKGGSSNMGTLIAAIVAPIVVVLLFAFGLFWWVMRRRAKKALKKEPEFVMEKRKRRHSRDDSTHSNSSTRKLVSKTPTSNSVGMRKEAVPAVSEISRPSMDIFSDSHEVGHGLGIGVAKSPDHTPAHSRQNSAEAHNATNTPSKAPVAVRNFSRGPARPSIANQESNVASTQSVRDRSASNPGARPLPPPGARPDQRRPPPNTKGQPPMGSLRGSPRGPPRDRNSPANRQGPGQRHAQGSMTSMDRSHSDRNRHMAPPSAIETRSDVLAEQQRALNPPTPTGAYNGASPISQYSPIIKQHPKIDGAFHGDEVSPQNSHSPSTPQLSSSFTEENMRIARLADSSRLGFYKDANNKALPAITTSTREEPTVEPPNPSPRLPPPATRDAPPFNFPPPPPPPEDAPMLPSSNSRRADSFVNDRRSMRSVRSMVSRLSDDDYVDMEVDDAKSDVSSLDERERWDMENESRNTPGSRAGNNSSHGNYGGLRAPGSDPRPPLLQSNGITDNNNSPGRF